MAVIVITGGHSGIGLTCARVLARNPRNHLVLMGRSRPQMEARATELRALAACAVTTVALDLTSLASVRAAAATLRTSIEEGRLAPIDALLINAGIQYLGKVPFRPSVDGFEETFAVNCLGNFLLLNLLLDAVSPTGRVVLTASGTHDPDSFDGRFIGKVVRPDAHKLAFDGRSSPSLPGGIRYSTSKLCDILYAYELHRRLRARGEGIMSMAYDPGFTPETGLARTSPKVVQTLASTSWVKWFLKHIGVTIGDAAFSGQALAALAVDPAYAHGSGKYFQTHDGKLRERKSSRLSYDQDLAKKLWEDSTALVGLSAQERPRRLT